MSDTESNSNQLDEKMETNQDAAVSSSDSKEAESQEQVEDEKMEVPQAEPEWEAPTGISYDFEGGDNFKTKFKDF